jgi:hypothetical protein
MSGMSGKYCRPRILPRQDAPGAGVFLSRNNMEKDIIRFALEAATALGSLCTGVAALIGICKVAKNLMYRNEILYGDEAAARFSQIKDNLEKAKL